MDRHLGNLRRRYLAPLAAIVAVGLLALAGTPTSGASAPVKKLVPPYLQARASSGHFGCWCGGSIIFTAKPTVNLTTGKTAFSLSASQASRSCPYICANADDYAGLLLSFKNPTNGTRNITVSWTVSWAASASCRGCGTQASASVEADVELQVVEVNATTTGYNNLTRVMFVYLSTGGSAVSSRGNRTVTAYVTVPVIGGHRDQIETWVEANVRAWQDTGGTSRASFDMMSSGYGMLSRVTIT